MGATKYVGVIAICLAATPPAPATAATFDVRCRRRYVKIGSCGANMLRCVTSVGLALTLVLFAAEARAALLAYDGFNYEPVGSELRTHSGGGSFGFSTGWDFVTQNNHAFDIGAGGLVDATGNLHAVGNHATSVAFGNNRNVERVFDTPLGVSGTTRYFSFLMRPEGVLGGGAYNGWFAFTLRGTWDLSLGSGGGPTTYSVGRAGAPSTRVHTSTHAVVGETRFIVLRADFADGADTYSVFIDPVPGAPEPAVPDAVASSFDLGTITRIGMAGPGAFSLDELRVGETFADVTPVTVVPEPSTYAMAALGLAVLGYLGVRRRRMRGHGGSYGASLLRPALAVGTVLVLVTFAAEARAALLAYDGFNYEPVGSDLEIHSGGGSFGFSTGWDFATLNSHAFDIGGGSLPSVGGGPHRTGNRVSAPAFGSTNRDVARQLAVPLGTPGTTAYVSFLMRPEVMIGGPGITDGWFGFVMRGSGSVHVGRESFSSVYRIEGNSSVIAHSSTPMVVDETRFLVLRADFAAGNDTYSLFIDPVPGQPEPAVADAVMTTFDAGIITQVGLTGPGVFGFDELRIGETFADVTPVPVVPEPSTHAMAVLGLFGMGVVGWRRSNNLSRKFASSGFATHGGVRVLAIAVALVWSVAPAQAALTISNGTFDNPYGPIDTHGIGDFWKYADDWYTTTPGSFKNFTYAKDGIFLPVDEYYAYVDRPGSSIYQSLGTREPGDLTIQFEFDAFERGESSGNGEAFEQVVLEIYYDDSGGSFSPANGTEVDVLSLLDSVTILGSSLGFDGLAAGGPEQALNVTTSPLDLTGAPEGSEIYLRVSQGGNDGEPFLDNLSSQVVSSTPVPSDPSFSTTSNVETLDVDFGSVLVNSVTSPESFEVANLFSSVSQVFLTLDGITGSGDTTRLTTDLAPFADLAAGDFSSFEAALDTSLPGLFGASYELSFTDILGTNQTLTLNLSGEVALPANDPNIPDLIYDAVTGEVILDPDGSSIIGYSLQNESGAFLPGNFNPVLGGVATATSIILEEATLGSLGGPASIGNVFPTGMDISELFALLSVNQVSRSLGTPLVPFDLIVVVPEPSTYAMACLSLAALGLLGRRRISMFASAR
ncbi:MAG: PEP-CTERM sorting domain-containing protein [Planctomycetota bacterium]|nr:MAG: PEP-CTERM sorting domain-containing protein [Planctomycetota bacterium]REJ90018.1 MAG: PEP-CTERM sorting domain-containing protein [Planctomycetota bacterium]REK22403.1 MAG: PEP-CTERM sorting domain-containing protein [Planctomycetota bacterium]REK39737.1 MAG: PEP-CTERM sorting domain-containing protein [Planctomycetota bacterium]